MNIGNNFWVLVISGACTLTLWLLIWFKTHALLEYAKLFGLQKFFKLDNYDVVSDDLTYPEYLKEYHNNFFSRLLSCPICSAVWLGTILSIWLVLAFGFMVGFISVPIITLSGLLLYLVTCKLL